MGQLRFHPSLCSHCWEPRHPENLCPWKESGFPKITRRQRQVLDYLRRTIERHGHSSSLREIGRELGIRSTNGVRDHIRALQQKGYLHQNRQRRARGWVPVTLSQAHSPSPQQPSQNIRTEMLWWHPLREFVPPEPGEYLCRGEYGERREVACGVWDGEVWHCANKRGMRMQVQFWAYMPNGPGYRDN